MEVFNPSVSDVKAFRDIVMQHGSGYTNDGYYIYSQDGEGIASFFGNLIKSALPIVGRTIKGAANIAKPHLQKAAADLVTAGGKRVLEKISTSQNPKKRKRRRI